MQIYEPIKIYDPIGEILLKIERTTYLTGKVRNSSVLHIGCSDYPLTIERLEACTLLHAHLERAASNLTGIDTADEGIKILKERGFQNVHVMDAEKIKLMNKYDYVIAGDVLEHMNNPGNFLRQGKDLLNPEGKLIIGVPNAYSFNILKYILHEHEPTHKDHTYFFSVKSLSQLCFRYDLLPIKLVFTAQPRNRYEKYLYFKIRNMLIHLQKRIAPSFMMEFMDRKYVDTSKYIEWE
jgi:SAM-dependent methyltransferase